MTPSTHTRRPTEVCARSGAQIAYAVTRIADVWKDSQACRSVAWRQLGVSEAAKCKLRRVQTSIAAVELKLESGADLQDSVR